MNADPFTQQILDLERLTERVANELSQAEKCAAVWPQTTEQIRAYVLPVLDNMIRDVEGYLAQLKQLDHKKADLNSRLGRVVAFPSRAKFHPRVIGFWLHILRFRFQYWLYRLLSFLIAAIPFIVAITLIILVIVFWKEIVTFLLDLIATLLSFANTL